MESPPLDHVEGYIVRHAVRVALFDARQQVLMLSTKDDSNSAFGLSWELPGGGMVAGETVVEAAIRELREETGIILSVSDIGAPLWHRDVLFTYRGERRLQREAICVAHIATAEPFVDSSGREFFEREDHQLYRWWTAEEMRTSSARFYPRKLPDYVAPLMSGSSITDPFETWE